MASSGGNSTKRLPLSRTRKRLKFERRIRLSLWLLAAPTILVGALLLQAKGVSFVVQSSILVIFILCWWLALSVFMEQIIRPLQTLANVVAALREDDYSFRARGARRDDALGDLAIEINALATMLQSQRVSALEAAALLQRVVDSLETPVLTLDQENILRLLNPAGARVLGLKATKAIGQSAERLGLADLLATPDEGVISLEGLASQNRLKPSRWMVRRTIFRQHGVPQTLVLLSDVSTALREEERQAWQRLIRVLGHEINNSLAPIKSIAGSLRSRLPVLFPSAPEGGVDFERGLRVIEDRSESLNRFVQAYRLVAQLPTPSIRLVALRPLIEHTASLETRLAIDIVAGADINVSVDPDQVGQLLINLMKNAVEAAIGVQEDSSSYSTRLAGSLPAVQVSWTLQKSIAAIAIRDNGPGLTNSSNLFVPFYTTKKNGTGVGLLLARQIAEANGGTVALANRTDIVGCEAIVSLPASVAVEETARIESRA
jgi:two-component system, NtrC family, nitrogen regulation sensor histidine kinase NtrY